MKAKIDMVGTSLAAQWVGLHLPVQLSLIGELRSHMPEAAF